MQVKEKVNASNLMMVGMQTGNDKKGLKTDKEANGLDFANIFSQSRADAGRNAFVKGREQDISNVNTFTGQNDLSEHKTAEKGIEKKSEYAAIEDVKSEKAAADDKDLEQTVLSEVSTQDMSAAGVTADEAEQLTDEELTDVLEAVSDILQMIMQQLGLSAEEVEEQLNAFGMNASDLMTMDGLKEFFLNIKSADVSDLLTDENLNQEWKLFAEQFNEILEKHGCDETDIQTVLKFMERTDGKESLFDAVGLKNVMAEKEQNQSEGMLEELADVKKEPEVIVSPGENQGMQDTAFSKNQSASNQMQGHTAKDLEQNALKETKVFENPILQAIHDAVSQVDETAVPGNEQVRATEIIDQIVEQVRVNMNQDTTSMELQLYPEHLGKIQINVVSKDGIMTARIVAETEAAKQAIEGGLTNLKEAMQHQNLKVEAIEVMVSTTGFERGNEEQMANEQSNTGRNRRKIDFSETEDEISTEEEVEIEKMRASGSSVSYMA